MQRICASSHRDQSGVFLIDCAGTIHPLENVSNPQMTAKLFEAALGISSPWYINRTDFDVAKKTLTIGVDFIAGSRFAVSGVEGFRLRKSKLASSSML